MFIQNSRRGFTLVELLAAMAILSILVLLLGRLFSDGSKIWLLGTKRVESNTDGRAVVDFMLRELSSAIADDVLTLKLKSNEDDLGDYGADRIYFVSADQKAERNGADRYRQGKQVAYRVAPMEDADYNDIPGRWRILRFVVERTNSVNYECYVDKQWWDNPAMGNDSTYKSLFPPVLAENVRTLEFWVYDREGQHQFSYDSSVHGPPSWVDIYVEMLGEEDAVKASFMSGVSAAEYKDRMAKRYAGRVYLHNAVGYGGVK